MKLMSGSVFADSNVLLYLLSNDDHKKAIAERLLFQHPVISTQVIAENINVMFRKFSASVQQTAQHKFFLEGYCKVIQIDSAILSQALALKDKSGYQWHDCIKLSAALANDCGTLYSEDMQHGQVIKERMTIMNPFRAA